MWVAFVFVGAGTIAPGCQGPGSPDPWTEPLSEEWIVHLDEETHCGGALDATGRVVLCRWDGQRSRVTAHALLAVAVDGSFPSAPDVLHLQRISEDRIAILAQGFDGVYVSDQGGSWTRTDDLAGPSGPWVLRRALALFEDGSVLARFDFLGQRVFDVLPLDEGPVKGEMTFMRLAPTGADTLTSLPLDVISATVGMASVAEARPFAPRTVVAGGGTVFAWGSGGDPVVDLLDVETGRMDAITVSEQPPALSSQELARAESLWLQRAGPQAEAVYSRILELSAPPDQAPWFETLWVSPEGEVWIGRPSVDESPRVWEVHGRPGERTVTLPSHLTRILDARGRTVLASDDGRTEVWAVPVP